MTSPYQPDPGPSWPPMPSNLPSPADSSGPAEQSAVSQPPQQGGAAAAAAAYPSAYPAAYPPAYPPAQVAGYAPPASPAYPAAYPPAYPPAQVAISQVGSQRPKARGGASWLGLIFAVAGTVGVGAGWWLALASISFTAKPLSQSVVWLLVAALSGLFTLTALVLCIVKLVKGGRRVVAAIGLAVALIGPPSATNLGFNAGLNDLYDHATAAAGYVVESVTELLGVTEMPAWLAGLLELLQ